MKSTSLEGCNLPLDDVFHFYLSTNQTEENFALRLRMVKSRLKSLKYVLEQYLRVLKD